MYEIALSDTSLILTMNDKYLLLIWKWVS